MRINKHYCSELEDILLKIPYYINIVCYRYDNGKSSSKTCNTSDKLEFIDFWNLDKKFDSEEKLSDI